MKDRLLNQPGGEPALEGCYRGGSGVARGWPAWAKVRSSARQTRPRFHFIEALEDRISPAAIVATWTGGDGDWNDPTKWDIGVVPNNGGGNTYRTVLNVPGDAQISMSGTFTLDSIVNHEALWLQNGSMLDLVDSGSVNAGLIQVQFSPNTTRLTLGGTFTNDGTIRTEQTHWYGHLIGELYLNADTLIDGTGTIEMNGGSTPVINGAPGADLTLGANQTLLGGGAINVPVINHGTLLADNRGWLYVTAGVTNDGVFGSKAGGYLSLEGVAGTTTTADITAEGGVVRLLNTSLELNGHALLADGAEVRLDNSTIVNGVVRVSDSSASVATLYNAVTFTDAPWSDDGAGYFQVPGVSATLLGDRHIPAGVNLVIGNASSVDLSGAPAFHNEGLIQLQYAPNNTRLTLGGTFTNDGTIRTEQTYWYGHLIGEFYLGADTLIDGTGTIEMPAGSTPVINGAPGATLTLGAEQTLRGSGAINVPVINRGTLQANVGGWSLTLNEGLTNLGELSAWNGGVLHAKKGVTLGEAGHFNGDADGYVLLSGDLLSSGTLGGGPEMQAYVRIEGSADPLAPRLIEVVGRELGYTPAGFTENNVFAPLTLTGGFYQLVNLTDDVAGDEAIYIDTLNVPAGATLDLNGQRIHVRYGALDGTIIGDDGAPTSEATVGAPVWFGNDLPVTWTGTDDAGGTGIACFDVYVSTDGGAFALWLDDTPDTAAIYPAEDGHTYGFYTIARDNLGYTELAPATTDATANVSFLAITSAPVVSVNEDAQYFYDAASNADGVGPVLAWSFVSVPSQLGMQVDTGEMNGVFDNAAAGDHAVTVRVSDDQGHHAEQTFTITVANVAGEFDAQTPGAGMLGAGYTFDLDSSDEGAGAVTYAIVSGPAWLTIDPASGVLGGTPRIHDLGAQDVSVSVDDGHGGTDTTSFTLDVQGQHVVLDPALPQTKTVFTDANGDAVTATLAGKTGRVHLYRAIAPDGTGQYLNTTAGDLFAIELDGTDTKSALALTPKANKRLHLGDGFSTFGSLTGDGSLARLSAAKFDLIGAEIDLPLGTIAALTLHDVKNGADITLGGAQALKGVSFTANNIEDGTMLALGSALKLLKAHDWAGGTLNAPSGGSVRIAEGLEADLTFAGPLGSLKAENFYDGSLLATTLGRLTIGEDASFDLTLTDALARTTLGTTRIGGDLLGSVWDVAGKIASITVARTIQDTVIRSGGDIGVLSMGASEGSVFGAGVELATLIANGHADTAPTGTIKTFNVKGWKFPKLDPIPRFTTDTQVSAKVGTMSLHNWDGLGGLWAPAGAIKKITHHDTALKDAEHNWIYPEPARQVSGQPELFVHLL